MSRRKELQDFIRVALECSVYVAPTDSGLSYDEIAEVGRSFGYGAGELSDAVSEVLQREEIAEQYGPRVLAGYRCNPMWDMFQMPEEPDYRNIKAFDIVCGELRDLARNEGRAHARLARDVLIERAVAKDIRRQDAEVAISILLCTRHLVMQDAVISFAPGREAYPLASEQRAQRGRGQYGARKRDNLAKIYPLVHDIIRRRRDARAVAVGSPAAVESPAMGIASVHPVAPSPGGHLEVSTHANHPPGTSLAQHLDIFDLAILCALAKPELDKVLDTGKSEWKALPARANDPSSYYETTYTTTKGNDLRVVAAAPTQMGMPASAVLATKMILSFRPKLIAMVGIAAGARRDKQNYGDILVPNLTFDYGAGKLTMDKNKVGFEPAPDPIRISERLRGRLDHWHARRIGLDEISQRWRARRPDTRLEIHVGPLGSGAAVIDTTQPVLDVLDHWRKLIGIEMEAYGVHLASQNAVSPSPEFLCMKSICDFASEKKDDWQDYAAFTAAELCHRFLTNEWEILFPGTR